MLWSRLLPKARHFRILSQSAHQLSASKPHHHISTPPFRRRALSTNHNNNNNNSSSSSSNNNDKFWNLSEDPKRRFDNLFVDDGNGEEASAAAAPRGLSGIADGEEESWAEQKQGGRRGPGGGGVDFFESIDKEIAQSSGDGLWSTTTAKVYKPWNLKDDGDGQELQEGDLFNLGERAGDAVDDAGGGMSSGLSGVDERRSSEDKAALEREEKELTAILKGPDRAFGDLIAASGITDAMLDSLIALKDFEGLDGLPPLSEIEGIRYQKNTKKSVRAELERQKQEEIAKARVREVDDKGRAYGTGKRKSSIARVWIQPGDGKFVVNDKQFDVYFPMLDHRAALLRPFSETKTLGRWDVSCTVKGGGVSGQVGAIQLGISRALQNWEPDLRPPLKDAGFLTRDSRVVERKKPGKAKARRSFQWVKR